MAGGALVWGHTRPFAAEAWETGNSPFLSTVSYAGLLPWRLNLSPEECTCLRGYVKLHVCSSLGSDRCFLWEAGLFGAGGEGWCWACWSGAAVGSRPRVRVVSGLHPLIFFPVFSTFPLI